MPEPLIRLIIAAMVCFTIWLCVKAIADAGGFN